MVPNIKVCGSLCIFAVFAGVLHPFEAISGERQILSGHVPAATANLVPLRQLAPETRLNLAIGLPLRNRQALIELVHQLYDPASPFYHQYITPEEFTQRFGPTEEDYQALISFAQANGFTVSATHPNRVLLDVNATVADIQRTLHLGLQVYRHPQENREFFAPDAEPSLDLSVPLASIVGLDNLVLPHPNLRAKALAQSAAPQPNSGSGPSGLYMGKDFRAAYAPGVSLNGSGQTVGLLQFDGYNASDITAYESAAGLPNVPLQNVLLDGFNGSAGPNNTEVALDIEMVASMAPGVSQIIVYEAGPSGFPNDILNRMATDNLAKQISSSWTWGGGTNSTIDGYYLQFAAQGQTYFNASGDSDAYTNNIAANYAPADDAYITVVGGTMLTTTGGGGSYISEMAWNRYNGIGSGGGISSTYFLPTWQQGISMTANLGSTTMRNIPDVALTAENVYLIAGGGKQYSVGGTSCASPLWAGFTALVNQQAVANTKPAVGFLNPAIYALGKSANYTACLHDITTGNNTNAASAGDFPAVAGYDLCTGWGSPVGQTLINALAPPAVLLATAGSTLLAESCTPTNGVIDPGETVTVSFALQNSGGASTANLVATLLATNGVVAPSGAQVYGGIPPGGGIVSRSFTFTANGTCGGSITPTLQLQDGPINYGTVSFPQNLGLVTPQAQFQNFDSVTAPALPAGWSSVVVNGTQTTWATTTAAFDTAPNSAFITDSPNAGENSLLSPVIPILSSSAQLSFRQNYTFESHTPHHGGTIFYDGGILEIQIGNAPFTDIVSAGGSFVTGGYNCTLDSGSGNPLGGSSAWGGSSGGWVTTTVNLPASAAGQNIQLRWSCGTGSGNTYPAVGWYVDTISIQGSGAYACCTPGVNIAPLITAQPTNTTVLQGSTANFQVAATGTPAPTYQWFFNSTTPLAGQTNSSLTLNNVQLSQAGGYSAIASNVAGFATSVVAQLTVEVAPSFTLQPTNVTVVQGNSAVFQATASGTPLPTYQWFFNSTIPLTGQTNSSLTLNNVQLSQAGGYSVIASNVAGFATSVVAQLTVEVAPSFTLQPTNVTVIQGNSAVFQAIASGTPLPTYQWFFNSTIPLTGQTNSSLTLNNVQPSQTGGYSAVASNAAGFATSVVAQLTVEVAPSFTLQPTNVTVVQGNNAVFQAIASGTPAPAYQWFFNLTTPLAGRTNSSLTLSNVQPSQAGGYSAVASNVAGFSTSFVAQLTVEVAPSFTLQPTNVTVVQGNSAVFQANASGTPTPAYQWFFNSTSPVPGETNSSLTLTNVQLSQAGSYSAVASNVAGFATSVVAQLTVLVPPAITTQPTNLVSLPGGSASFAVGATGAPAPAYQWFFNTTNLLVGATSNVLALTNVQGSDMGGYSAIITNSAGSVTSAVAQLKVLVSPVITLSGVDMAAATVSVSVPSLAGLNYQLEYKNSLTDTNWIVLSPVLGGIGTIITLQDTNALATNRFYRVMCY